MLPYPLLSILITLLISTKRCSPVRLSQWMCGCQQLRSLPALSHAWWCVCTFHPATAKHAATQVEDWLFTDCNKSFTDPVTQARLCLLKLTANTHTAGMQVFHNSIPSPRPGAEVALAVVKLSLTCACRLQPLPCTGNCAEIPPGSTSTPVCPSPLRAPAEFHNTQYVWQPLCSMSCTSHALVPTLPAKTRPICPNGLLCNPCSCTHKNPTYLSSHQQHAPCTVPVHIFAHMTMMLSFISAPWRKSGRKGYTTLPQMLSILCMDQADLSSATKTCCCG